jgi:lipopolysaccharide transport system ATP-binding protein
MFTEGVQRAMGSVGANAGLIRKVAFPHRLLVYAAVLATVAVHAVGFIAVIVVLKLDGRAAALSAPAARVRPASFPTCCSRGAGRGARRVPDHASRRRARRADRAPMLLYASPVLYPASPRPRIAGTGGPDESRRMVLERMREVLMADRALVAGDLVAARRCAAAFRLGPLDLQPHLAALRGFPLIEACLVMQGRARRSVRIAGVAKEYPKLSTGRRPAAHLCRAPLSAVSEIPHFTALDDINLEVWRGQSLGIVGETGAGNRRCLKIIAGVVRPDGEARCRSEAASARCLELGSGFHPDYTGRENIYLSSALMGPFAAARRSRRSTRSWISPTSASTSTSRSSTTPRGMSVRLGFAVAHALTPDVLITDEVLAVGDESFQKKCIQWLSIPRGGGTLLLCSHSMFHVQTLCRQALWIHHGRARHVRQRVRRDARVPHVPRGEAAEGARGAPRPHGLQVESARIENARARVLRLRCGEDIVVQAIVHEPDDRPPVLMLGIVRVDGTPVYGTHSNDTAFQPRRIAPAASPSASARGAALIPAST